MIALDTIEKLPLAILWTRDVHGNGNFMGMGIKHRIGNGNRREWETISVGMGITCTPMGIYSHGFFCCV